MVFQLSESFLSISKNEMNYCCWRYCISDERVEFYSNNESVGMHIVMTMDGFIVKYINSNMALPHHGLKIIIKRAKKPVIQDSRIIEYLSRRFAIRVARGAKISVNGIAVHKPDGFDPRQFELFKLDDGSKVFGNLKNVEKPQLNNIDIFVKKSIC